MKPVTKVGDRFGRWTVTRPSRWDGRVTWTLVECSCGTTREVNKRLSIETEEIKTMITELVFYVGLLSVALYIYSISKWSGLLL